MIAFFRRLFTHRKPMSATPPTAPTPVTPLDVARRYLGVREASKNRAPEILAMWPDTSYGVQGHTNREPWCATLICHCLAQAAREGWQHQASSLPRNAKVSHFLSWAKSRPGVEVFAPTAKPLRPNDIVVFLPRLSHIGILERVEGTTLHTIEGNTDSGGSREGDGCYRRTRKISYPGHIIRFL